MNKKTVKTIARGGVLALAGLVLFSLLAKSRHSESLSAAGLNTRQ